MKKLNFRKIMDKISEYIVKNRVAIIVIFAVILCVSIYGMTLTKVNSDVMSYLPEGTATCDGLQFFSENFALESNAVYAIDGDTISYEDLKSAVDEMQKIEQVSSVLWLGSMKDLNVGGTKLPDPFQYMEGGADSREKIEELFHKDGNYLLIISLNVGASDDEAGQALDKINSLLGDAKYSSGGTAPVARKVYDDAISELPIYLSVAIVLVLILLFLVSANYLEPLIFMLTMGVSIAVNMGSNFIFGEISIITFCAASILQIALAMDYSIFLTEIYTSEKQRGLPQKGAMINAIGTTFNTVCASALTTMGGFAAFFVMSFTLGADLGGVLIKGIALAVVTVIILQPCLLLLLSKPMQKTGHKRLINIKFKRMARFSVNRRVIIVIAFGLLLVPAFIGQYLLPLSYLNFMPNMGGEAELREYVSSTSNQIFIAVPVDSSNPQKNIDYVNELEGISGINSVAGYYAFLPEEAFDSNGKLEINVIGKLQIDSIKVGKDLGLVSEGGYTMYMVAISPEFGVESEDALKVLSQVRKTTADCFGNDFYCTGTEQAVAEFKEITPHDFKWVTIISVVIIFIVLIFSLKNIVYPILLVLLIELGTWINFSLSTIFGQSLNFLAYIVVGAIQLGATVDYAILVTNKYRALVKEGKDPLTAAYESGTGSTMSILTSASIMIVACASVTIISSNAVIKEVTQMVMRGAIISTMLVLFVLPSLLACTSGLNNRKKAAGGMHNLTSNFLKTANAQVLYGTRVRKAKQRIRKEKLLKENECVEDLQCHGLVIIQPKKGYRFNSDSVILANSVFVAEGAKVADFGCGSGIMSFIISAKKHAKLTGIEIQPSLADMAKRSARANCYENKVNIIEGDIKMAKDILGLNSQDAVVCNPPYYKTGSGAVSENEEQAIARHEVMITLEGEVNSAYKVLKEEGEFYIILPTCRENELSKLAESVGFSLRKKIYLAANAEKKPDSFIAVYMKGVSAVDAEVTTLITKDKDGGMSKEVEKLYRQ